MDQLRTALSWLKRHHFWVLNGLVALIGLGCWWSAAGSLSEQYKKNESQIKAEFSNLSTLRGKPFHPNPIINEKQAAEVAKMAESVGVVWQQLYDRQRESVLEWPAALSQAFRDHVEKLSFGDEIPNRLRQNYQDYVEQHFPNLPKMIGARVLSAQEAGSFGGGEMGRGGYMPMMEGGPGMLGTGQGEDEGDYTVEWLDQAHVRDDLNFPQRPSALRIWWTQENLWVYETLLTVIRNTNEAAGATRKSNAAVRTVFSLQVGRDAAKGNRTPNRIYKPPTAAPAPGSEMMAEGAMSMEGGEAGPMPGGEMSFQPGSMGQGPVSPEEEAAFLLSGRYLGSDGKPIAAGGGGGGEAADPSMPAPPVDLGGFGTEYKRLPVRMVLQIDQRWLPHLIAQCASQPLQVEVQEVRINPDDGGGMEGSGFGGGFRGGFGGGMTGGSQFPQLTGVQAFPQQPQLVNVIVQGIIYIFNKPNPSVLQATESAEPMAGL